MLLFHCNNGGEQKHFCRNGSFDGNSSNKVFSEYRDILIIYTT